ncbi:hypothetical protein OIDMADRAFT_162306 [Oidiodendron maius Zn]|uniref:Purine nucleoside permease n=1 Tax=Oidiodendron maius (strain Zn) TaxID=913774 RepID=A0A0C3HIT0_OIDMZ|nr:hypothetical protein OIDMADRAFT_162306 [Oidiodendron maius Zn]
MRFYILSSLLAVAAFVSASQVDKCKYDVFINAAIDFDLAIQGCPVIAPKVFIISMFEPEADIWYSNAHTPGSIGNLLARNITIPGLSPLYPQVHCLEDGSVCQVTTGESEINAATTISALVQFPAFDLKETYFMIAGIAGVNPKYGTIGAVAFSKYAIQVALQYEFDAREIPDNFSTGYIPLGSFAPDQYPQSIYGTEVFEVNEDLRDIAVGFAKTAKLNDSSISQAYRSNYAYPEARKAPSILCCDVVTSDVYFSGKILGEAFENTTTLFTNGSGIYCTTAQEDNATLEVLLRAAIRKTVDFARIIVMRTASDFDRPYPGQSDVDNLMYANQGSFEPAINNIYLAGTPVVKGILEGWEKTFKKGIKPSNYIGDIFGTLGGKPDFGPGSVFGGVGYAKDGQPLKRGLTRRDAYKTARVI